MSCKEEMESWRVQSPEAPGFHAVITPEKCACKETRHGVFSECYLPAKVQYPHK